MRTRNGTDGRVEGRRVAGRGSCTSGAFAAGPQADSRGHVSFPALRTRRADFRHRALQWNHAARTRVPGHDQRAGLASRGTKLAPLRRPAGASSGLLTPWRQRPFGSSPSLVHVMTSGISAHLRGTRPSATPVSLLPFAIAVHLRSLPSAGITRFPRYYGPLRHPARPDLTLAGCRLARATPPPGLPVLRPFPSSMRAVATTPAESVGVCVARFPTHASLPSSIGESASALIVSRPARRSLALPPAWSLGRPRRPFVIRVLQPMSLPPSSAPTATGWSDGVDASPGRHRNVPRWMCRDTTHLKEEASSGTRYHHRDRLGEAQFSAPWRTGRRVGCVPQEAEPEQGAGFRGVAAALCRGDGGLREFTPLGPRDRKARSCGEARPTDLREAVREAAEETTRPTRRRSAKRRRARRCASWR